MPRRKQLIINADDFGLHHAVNEAVITGLVSGCLTSCSIMVSGDAWQEAAELARENPRLGVGLHLTLVGEKPVSEPASIPSLVNSDGVFPADYGAFVAKLLKGQISLREVRRELAAQFDRAVDSGLEISHVDSHQHLHVLPSIIDIVLELAAEKNIKAMRIPDESIFFTGGFPFALSRLIARNGLTAVAQLARHKAKKRGFLLPDKFFGMLAGGNMNEEYLINIIRQLRPGVSEIMLHPGIDDPLLREKYGWGYNWLNELNAITSDRVWREIYAGGVRLISFRELAHG